jgi:immunity protein 27 of polymorphic toxin system
MTISVDEGDPMFAELFAELDEIAKDNWALLYRHRTTGDFWDVTFPQSEMHGGGPRILRRLTHSDPSAWVPYPDVS